MDDLEVAELNMFLLEREYPLALDVEAGELKRLVEIIKTCPDRRLRQTTITARLPGTGARYPVKSWEVSGWAYR
jgi:hypothetical protein